MTNNDTYTMAVIDFSGSMRGNPINNVMPKLLKIVQELKKKCTGKWISSAISFQGITIKHHLSPESLYFDWKNEKVFCSDSTPLHDAILEALAKITKSSAKNKILIIGTDGKNNSSKVTDPNSVKAKMIEFMEKYDGMPIYLSSGLDAWTDASALGLAVNTCLATNFDNEEDTNNASQAVTEVCTQYMQTPSRPQAARATTLPCFTVTHRQSSNASQM